MKGLYLYCIRDRVGSDSKFFGRGINGSKVFIISHQDLEAIVSEVSSEEFDSEEIQKKAQEDLKWIKEKAQLHEAVVEWAMKRKGKVSSIIPLKFGTIFKTKKKLEETLKKYYSKFKKTLENLKGKQEWGVKVYLNRKAFKEELKKVSPVVQEKEKEIASMPEGTAYFMQKEIDEAVSKEVDKTLQKYIESFFENIKKYTEVGTKGKILEKELTGKTLPMILNAIFLVSEEKLEDFIKEVNKLNREYKPKGFSFEYSGPWPPYNFI